MKIQYLAVIFVIIVIPISLVMTQYLQSQITTITLQSKYTANLNDATHDALWAFQINSINNKYSSVSDSKIRDIEASINTFYHSLGLSMNQYVSSREDLSGFIPAILFTLYDGYYINSSYNNLYTSTGTGKDKQIVLQNNRNYEEGLKPYIYYSCQYRLANGNVIVVNYTLDNAITVYGDFGSGYETKSGYLINPNEITDINETKKTLKYRGVLIEPESLTEHLLTIEDEETGTVKQEDYNYIIYENSKVYKDNATGRYFWYDNYKKSYLQGEEVNLQAYLNKNGVGFKSISAYEYYKDAKEFSEWVNDHLGNITQTNVLKFGTGESLTNDEVRNYLSVDTEDSKIFKTTTDDNDPMLSGSVFNTHRTAVIRKSIETNLMAAFAMYNVHNSSNYEFAMPVLLESDWDRISNNVSIVAFMQGLPIGQKYYNQYSVISNTRNGEVVNEQSVYVLVRDGDKLEYHQPGCKELINAQDKIIGTYPDISFMKQKVEVSNSNVQYFYPQARVGATTTGCYNCIVNATGNYDIDSIIEGTIKDYLTGQVLYNENDIYAVRKAYLTGIARERKDLYKSNFE